MSENLRRDQAVQALDEIRARQHQVVTASVIPGWFWSGLGALMVVFTFGVESHRPLYIGVCTTVFVLGLNAIIWAVVLRNRAGVRPHYLGRPGIGMIFGFAAALVTLGLGVGFALLAVGFRWPATGANAVVAVVLAVGGPWLMRRLRQLMVTRADAMLDGDAR
jgi:hypothetical protein